MASNRKIPYGYHMQNGLHCVEAKEAKHIFQMVTWYMEGIGYQQISDQLNTQRIPFSPEAPLWNKNKVKRLLDNNRYLGDESYPAILTPEQVTAVRNKQKEKSSGKRISEQKLDLPVFCGDCGSHCIRQNGSRNQCHWKCSGQECQTHPSIPTADLEDVLQKTIQRHIENPTIEEWNIPVKAPTPKTPLHTLANRKDADAVALLLAETAEEYEAGSDAKSRQAIRLQYFLANLPPAPSLAQMRSIIDKINLGAEQIELILVGGQSVVL